MSDLPLLYWGQKVGACLMLSEYQSAFYNMMVKGEQEKLKEYVGSTLPWQFRVYQGNYFNSLFSSLNKTYRRFITLVSPDFCRDIFSDYIAENPSINQNLSEYGLDLSIWLKANSGQYVIPRCATEMAELDALLHLSYYQSNTPAFNAKQFSNLTETEQVETEFYRLNSIYTYKSVWDFDEVLASDDSNGISPGPHDIYYVIYRNQGVPTWQKVPVEIYDLMCVLDNPTSLEKMSLDGRLTLHDHLPYLIQKSWVTSLCPII